jgi:Flp pilus assembly protein TadG
MSRSVPTVGAVKTRGRPRGPEPFDGGQAGADQEGSAVVDFVLVGALVTLLFLACIQLALVLHVRNTALDAASSGARYGVLTDRGPSDARARTEQLLRGALNQDYAGDVTVATESHQGRAILKVTVRVPLPMIGLIGPAGALEVAGHAALQG